MMIFTLAARDLVWLTGMGTLSAWRWDGARLIHAASVGAEQGLPMVAPSGVTVDGVGTLWMTSMRGLVRYDPQRKRVRVFGVRDGLPSQEFSDSPIQLSPLGYLAVGTAAGLVVAGGAGEVSVAIGVALAAVVQLGAGRPSRCCTRRASGSSCDIRPA